MSERNEPAAFDPSEPIVQFYETLARNWADTMSRTVASRGVAEFLGWQIETSFGAMGWLRRQVSDLVSLSLRQMNVPQRSEILALGERLTRLEMTLDDLDAKLDDIRGQLNEGR